MYNRNQIKQLQQSTEKLAKRKSCWYGFLYGIALGLGATIGATIITGIALYVLQNLRLLPFLDSNALEKLIELLKQNTS
jgi:hypothetical protein